MYISKDVDQKARQIMDQLTFGPSSVMQAINNRVFNDDDTANFADVSYAELASVKEWCGALIVGKEFKFSTMEPHEVGVTSLLRELVRVQKDTHDTIDKAVEALHQFAQLLNQAERNRTREEALAQSIEKLYPGLTAEKIKSFYA